MDFDPAAVSYDDLLDTFWTSHDATRPAFKTQYASAILAHDEEQLRLARDSAERVAQIVGRPVATRIEMLDRFWLAEDYHQKYVWKHDADIRRKLPIVGEYSMWAIAHTLGEPLAVTGI